MKKWKRVLAAALAVAMTVGMLAGCSGGSGSSGSSEGAAGTESGSATGDHGDTLRVALTSEPPSLTTCDHDSLISVGINMLTYNGLVRIDNATLMPELDLASEYKVENEVDWIFKLKEGVKFHNGEEMTSADVVASLEYAKSIPGSAIYTNNFANIEAVDDYTVKITTPQPYAGLLYDLGYHYNWIVPKSLLDSGNDFNENPIGTGPYKLVEWVSGTSLKFEAFEDYFDTERAAKIKNLEFSIIPEGVSRAIALEAGEIDFVWEANGADAASLRDNPDVVVEEVESVDNVMLFFNIDNAPRVHYN